MALRKPSLSALKKSFWTKVVLALLIFGLGFLASWLLYGTQKPIALTTVRNPDNNYPLINPILYSSIPESLSFPKYTPLNNALSSYTSQALRSKQATAIAVYFRDMNTSNWVGINPTSEFDGASMLKVVTLIALLHASEANPQVLSAKIVVPANITIPGTGIPFYYPPSDPVTSGNTYSVSYLMQRLITQSDNGADSLLISYLGDPAMATVYSALHIPSPGTTSGISPQDYSHLFRVLYNATYLSNDNSEAALTLLTQTTFARGLVAGVPTGTLVAHKFGESMDPTGASSTASSTAPGLSDCGIIYYPDHPYFLCVMTRGTSYDTLSNVIAGISKVTWDQVTRLYPTN
jgi:beta-lactamase class A